MTTTSSLAGIELELPIRPIVDDLADFSSHLSLQAGLEQGYAAFAARRFPVGDIAVRAVGYADEITRFLALAGTSDRRQVAHVFDVLIALSFLNAAAAVAVALVPPRLPADVVARRRVLSDIINAVGDDEAFASLARKAFAHDGVADAGGATNAGDAAAESGLEDAGAGRATTLRLEQGLSLMAFLRSLAPAGTLVERARLQLDDAGRFALAAEADELDGEQLDRLQRAMCGARLLAAADLARACLIDAVAEKDGTVRHRAEHLALRLQEARLHDVVMFAQAAAERLTELRRMQRQIADAPPR